MLQTIVCDAGLVFFVINLITAGWIKFSPNKSAPACVTVILTTALIYLAVTNGRWVKHIFGKAHHGKVCCPANVSLDCSRMTRLVISAVCKRRCFQLPYLCQAGSVQRLSQT